MAGYCHPKSNSAGKALRGFIADVLYARADLLGINPQIYVDRRPRVELAHRLGIALVAFELRVDFVVDTRGKRGEAVDSVLPCDKRFNRTRASVREINDRAP